MILNSYYLNLIEAQLDHYLSGRSDKNNLEKAIEYSLKQRGKRLRPILILEFCDLLGTDVKKALPFACAMEMIHTYSLIHDDMPCMDDDDLRRGVPTNHKVFGERVALLAGDALLNLAFEVMLSQETVDLAGKSCTISAARTIANAAGKNGMILGQLLDIESENKDISLDELRKIHINKTAKLIIASTQVGCIVAGANEAELAVAEKYGENLGLAFQVMDDILDVTSTKEVMGKNPNSDISKGKATYVSLLGLKKSKDLVVNLTNSAINNLEMFGDKKERLCKIAADLSHRIK